jgi:hypothetical protein
MDRIECMARNLGQIPLAPGIAVVGFRTRRDGDLLEDVADVLFSVDDGAWVTAELDAVCQASREALSDYVAYAYCDFRPTPDAKAALTGNEGWIVPLFVLAEPVA